MKPNTMSFVLYRRPGGVVFLDDDRDYLEMLAEVMPADWHAQFFLRPVACIEALLQEPARREADAWQQQEIVNRWREGASLIPQILRYWREDGIARFALTRVCVVDYAMPAMSGLRVLSELTDWSGSRILLTGRADEQLAISAFNRGLIEQFIPKQSPGLRLHLTTAVQNLRQLPDERYQQVWRATLTREQHALLCDPLLSRELESLALKQGWIEHVVLGAPFGVLALDQNGGVSWLQLEPADKLQELAEMAASQAWDEATVQDIRTGKTLVDVELQLALGVAHKPQPRQAFAMACGLSPVHAAIVSLSETLAPGAASGYARFLASSDFRRLQD
jgi:CheY-like chemotaxis protein